MVNRRFDYRELCQSQVIGVTVPEGTFIEESEIDLCVDLLLKSVRLFNRVERLRHVSYHELRFCYDNKYPARTTATAEVASCANEAFKYLETPVGLMPTVNKLRARELSPGMVTTRMLISNSLSILYTQLRSVLGYIIGKNARYEKLGSDGGVTPFLDTGDLVAVLEKCIHMQNYLYDMIYVLSTVTISTLTTMYADKATEELKRRIKHYEIFEGEAQSAVRVLTASFSPESRFHLEDDEILLSNF